MQTTYIIGFGSLALLPSCHTIDNQPSIPTDKPNIVFILIDDMGYSDLACYGNRFHESPHIDALAAEGMRFTHAYAASPVSSPSRASLLTGKYPVRYNITDWIPGRQSQGPCSGEKMLSPRIRNYLPLEEITIAEKLKNFGYTTAIVGKWHIGDTAYFPYKQGFDVSIGCKGAGALGFFYPYIKNGTLFTTGSEGEYLTDRLTSEAIEFIKANKNNPFFLYLSHYAVHIPLQAKQEIIDKYAAKMQNAYDSLHHNPTYAAMIEILDQNIGRLTKTLDSLQLLKNTLIIFFSDNGGLHVEEGPHNPATSNYPLRAGKGHLYEGGIRVPMIVKWPSVAKAGTISDAVVSSIDFFPTIMQILGIEEKNIDGKSFFSVLRGNNKHDRGPLFWHYPHYSNQDGYPAGAIRVGQYKLIEFFEDRHLELYDLHNDISERNNLVDAMPKKTKELYNQLKKWQIQVNAQMPEILTNNETTEICP